MNKVITVIITTVLLFSCSTTKITSSWKAEDHAAKQYYNIMVWGILTEKDSTLRKQIETHLVNDLIEKGYHTVSSIEVYRSKAYKKLTKKEIVDEFKETGVDAIITLVLLNRQKEELFVPPSISSNPVASFDDINKYYSSVFDKIYTPGYYFSSTNYYWESNLFEVKEDKLVYSVQTKSFDPSNTEILAHENGTMIIKDMIRKKVIISKNPIAN